MTTIDKSVPNTQAIPEEDTYVTAYILKILQKNKWFENIRIPYFAIKCFQEITGYENVPAGGLLHLVLGTKIIA